MSFPKIQLTEVLTYLEKEEEEEDKPYLFINPSQDLYTFFKYKGNKIDLVKERIQRKFFEQFRSGYGFRRMGCIKCRGECKF